MISAVGAQIGTVFYRPVEPAAAVSGRSAEPRASAGAVDAQGRAVSGQSPSLETLTRERRQVIRLLQAQSSATGQTASKSYVGAIAAGFECADCVEETLEAQEKTEIAALKAKDQLTRGAADAGDALRFETGPDGQTYAVDASEAGGVGETASSAASSAGETGRSESGSTQSELTQSELTEAEADQVDALKERDAEVRAHEQAHASVGGQYAGSPSYDYQTGPDSKRYAIGGEVPIDVSPIPGNPEATAEKMRVVERAALAPAEPSPQDHKVAQQARAQRIEALAEARELKNEELAARLGGATDGAASGGAVSREAETGYARGLAASGASGGAPRFDLAA